MQLYNMNMDLQSVFRCITHHATLQSDRNSKAQPKHRELKELTSTTQTNSYRNSPAQPKLKDLQELTSTTQA